MHRAACFIAALWMGAGYLLHSEDLIDLRQGFGKAKWGMSAGDLKKESPTLEDVSSRALPKERDSRRKEVVLAMPGEAPVVETRYIFELDQLTRILRTFDKSVNEIPAEILREALEEHFVKPAPAPVDPNAPRAVPGAPPSPVAPMRRRMLLPGAASAASRSSFNTQVLNVAGRNEEILAMLRFSDSDPNWIPTDAKQTRSVVQLHIDNISLDNKVTDTIEKESQRADKEAARKLAPALLRP